MFLEVLGCDLKGADLVQCLQALLNILVWREQDEPERESEIMIKKHRAEPWLTQDVHLWMYHEICLMYDRDRTELTGLSIFREILISLCSLWSFKSVDISEDQRKWTSFNLCFYGCSVSTEPRHSEFDTLYHFPLKYKWQWLPFFLTPPVLSSFFFPSSLFGLQDRNKPTIRKPSIPPLMRFAHVHNMAIFNLNGSNIYFGNRLK